MLQLTSLSARACGQEKDLARLPRSSVFFSGFIANGKFVVTSATSARCSRESLPPRDKLSTKELRNPTSIPPL
jgi:hypothetical protein